MDVFADIHAQPTAVGTLGRALAEDRVASAYLLEGPGGVGKRRVANAFAEALLAPGNDAAAERTRQRIRDGNHPDVRVFAPREDGHRNLAVETVREEILPFTQFAPFEAKHAVLIFPEADVSLPEQHPEAANALLKTLEEPRKGVHFVLLADRPDRLLRTVRSRCQPVRFGRLPAPVIHQILDAEGCETSGRNVALALADGRAGRALQLMEHGGGAALLERAQSLRATLGAGHPGKLIDASEALAKDAELPLVLDALTFSYREDVASACLGAAGPNGDPAQKARLEQATQAILRIRACVDSLEWNANRASALDAMLFDLVPQPS